MKGTAENLIELKAQHLPATEEAADAVDIQKQGFSVIRFKLRRYWLWGVMVLATVVVAAIMFDILSMSHPQPVRVEIAKLAPVARILAVNGRMAADQQVEVRSLIAGTLKDLPVSEGDLVTSGQVLAEIESAASQAAVAQAEAARDNARAVLEEATDAYDRAVSLGANISRAELESRAYDVQMAEADLAGKAAMLEQASADLEIHTIRAPIAGSIISLDVENGQVVGSSFPILTLANLGDLIVEADVDEAYATQIIKGQPTVLQLAGATATRTGRVSFVSKRVDIATGGLAIEVRYDEPVVAPVGLTVTINIIVEQRETTLTIPRTAMVIDESGTSIFLLADGAAEKQAVTVIDWPAERLIVEHGLAEGDIVIVDPEGLSDGQAVVAEKP
jgi:RND family efflux transporter MFP subunit